jgi:ABC-type dipeptide/oligopeptide/nickel transport system permease subunit
VTLVESTEHDGVPLGDHAAGDVRRRFLRDKAAVVGLAFIALLLVLAVFGPWLAPEGLEERNIGQYRDGPSAEHWFGTDDVGRDVFSQVIHGARVSMKVGLLATAIELLIGVSLGAIAGYFGGWLDSLLMRVTDVGLSIPYLVLAVSIAAIYGRNENSVILVLGLTGWLGIIRIVRSSFLALKEREFAEAARSLGFSHARIIFRHLLPNALQPVIVYGTISIGAVVLSEAALSFLNVGAVRPTASWGLMISEAGSGSLANAPHMLFFPGLAITLTVLAFVFVGDGLRDALDPKLRGRE